MSICISILIEYKYLYEYVYEYEYEYEYGLCFCDIKFWFEFIGNLLQLGYGCEFGVRDGETWGVWA